jgi:hypothetical protein
MAHTRLFALDGSGFFRTGWIRLIRLDVSCSVLTLKYSKFSLFDELIIVNLNYIYT